MLTEKVPHYICERQPIRQFNGLKRQISPWDGLHRVSLVPHHPSRLQLSLKQDKDLWLEDGDCLIHLYILGGSQRGPSLRLRYVDVGALHCNYLTEQCLHVSDHSSPTKIKGPRSGETKVAEYEIYIPAPATLSRDQAYAYHLTTRNFFAYAASKPLVGERLGKALVDLLDRIREWQPNTAALANFMSYCQDQGYQEMSNNQDCALACLKLAEHAKLKELWVEAFVHCVGMRERLELSAEYTALSETTKALIIRASLEMDLHLGGVARAVGSFLEEELGPRNLGLSKTARDHLDRFRSFLHNYYVEKLGYFPPNVEEPWNKRRWSKMHHAFQMLYEYLVDNESSMDLLGDRGVTGGICVVQNIKAFDARHGYSPLPHPLPLLPVIPEKKRSVEHQISLRNFKLSRTNSIAEQQVSIREALLAATNASTPDDEKCELVAEYQRFERQRLEEKLTPAEARKIRWLLIYGTLQMLISVTRVPSETRAIETVTYPLCALTTGGPAWLDEKPEESRPTSSLKSTAAVFGVDTLDEPEGRIPIRPDCEAETAHDYFSSRMGSRRASDVSFDMTPPPLRTGGSLSRTNSLRSSVHALQRSFLGSIGGRGSIRRTPPSASRPLSKTNSVTAFCEILVDSYGNGVGTRFLRDGSAEPSCKEESDPGRGVGQRGSIDPISFAAFDFGLDQLNEEPVLEDAEVSNLLSDPEHHGDMAPQPAASEHGSDSCESLDNVDDGDSHHRYSSGSYDTSATELSPWATDNESKRNSEITEPDGSFTANPDDIIERPAAPKQYSYQRPEPTPVTQTGFGVRTKCYSVSAGCYIPSGMVFGAQPERLASPVSRSPYCFVDDEDACSSESNSTYGEDVMQAGDVELYNTRGRRWSRGMDQPTSEEVDREGRTVGLIVEE